MKKFSAYILVISGLLLAVSCQESPDPGGTATQAVAGEWWVKYYVSDGAGGLIELDPGYYKAMTYNTAANTPDSIWVTDLAHFWDFAVKVGFDKSTNTFSASEVTNISYDDSEVTITNGQVLLGQGKSTSGVTTDSIYFVASFNDDSPAYGNEYIIAGHRRTGFLEDEHE